jgi:squalene-associated FAD-dependent desaturase
MSGSTHVAIIGGGYAGMAAAVTLADKGVPVTVYEAGPAPGGRARRVEIGGVALDNGLHILIGAYHDTLHLIQRVNRDADTALLRLPLDWHMLGKLHLTAPAWPAPWHLAKALFSAQGPAWRERFAAIRMMQALRASKFQLDADITVDALLARHDQGPVLTEHLWRPLCVSALNTPPAIASAQVFLNVLRDGLNASRADSELIISRVDLSALFPEPAAEFVRAQGGEVRTQCRVTSFTADSRGFRVAHGEGASGFSHIICALPPHQVAGFIAHALPDTARLVDTLDYQPITSVWLQFAGRVRLPSPMVGLAGCVSQWVFDRETICRQSGLVGVVISASGEYRELTHDTLAARVLEELAQHFGPLPPLQWQRVFTEKRATFSATPGLQRPPQHTSLKNFWLAGDYTAGDYPSTIESAVRSGILCAEGILSSIAAL